MAHKHSVYDTDLHFKIDAQTRSAPAKEKVTIVQHDHNSERITFEIPRYVEEHDMSLCNVVQIHYLNVDANRKDRNYAGIYEVDDLQISSESEDIVVCSWLISGNATQYVGSLNFVIRFMCVSEDGTIDYAWNTAVHSNVVVAEGINNTDVVVVEYADVLLDWEKRITALEDGKSAHVLTEQQKAEIKALADAYQDGNANFFYDSNIAHNNYANNSCWDSSKSQFGLCCNTFVSFVWMGRAATDFIGKDGTKYSNKINKAFDWGYMFTFPDRRAIAGAAVRDEKGGVEYYNYVQPNGDDTWSYSTNSRYDPEIEDTAKYPNHQRFNSFLNTDCVALELYRMGCEIPYEELDVGDLVFIKERWKADSEKKTFENNLRWRNISHVLMVFEKDANGTLTFIECSYPVPDMPIFKCSTRYDSVWNTARAIDVIGNVAMCARHPAAFGKSNMSDIEYIDHVPMFYNTGYSVGQAIPFVSGMAVTEGLWYVCDNELGKALTTGTAAAWDSTNFNIQYTNAKVV